MGRPSLGRRDQISLRLPEGLLERIDSARGVVTRDAWLAQAASLALSPVGQALARGQDPATPPEAHTHTRDRPHQTIFVDGQRTAYYQCRCGVVIQ